MLDVNQMLVQDPVCQMSIDPKRVKNKYQDEDGSVYYFCSSECKSMFENEKDKFRK
jgi:YHS domain-containing protein